MSRLSSTIRLFLRFLATVCMVCALISAFGMSASAASIQGSDTSFVRVIHASPFISTADVFVDGKRLLSSFQFAAVTDYVPVPPGAHRVQIALVGKGINASVITQDLTVKAGLTYTVAALGATPNTLSLQAFSDDNSVATNQAKVRIYHLAPDGGDVNVSIGNNATLKSLSYQDASNYVTVDTGSVSLQVSDPKYNTTLPLSMNLSPNTVTSVFTVGLFNGNPKIQLVSAQTKGMPGMPGTGSDPNVHSAPSFGWLLIPWLFGFVALVLLWPGSVARRLKRAA